MRTQPRSKDPAFAARVQLTRQASELGRRTAWAEAVQLIDEAKESDAGLDVAFCSA
eukprot:s1481_g1.t1